MVVLAVAVVFSKPNLTSFALLFLGSSAGEGKAPAAAWPQGGGKVCPRDVASELEERCDLTYVIFTFNLVPIPDYSRRTKEHCRTTIVANRSPAATRHGRKAEERCVLAAAPVSRTKGTSSILPRS